MLRQIDFVDGFETETAPAQGTITSTQVQEHPDDASFIAAKGIPVANGDVYYNTTRNAFTIYVGSLGQFVDEVNVKSDQIIEGEKTFEDPSTFNSKPTVNADMDINGKLTVEDLDVTGSTTTLNTETVESEDNNFTLNKGGNDASAEGGGFTVERTGVNGSFAYEDALASKFKAGSLGSESEVITSTAQQTLSNKNIDLGTASATNRIVHSKDTLANLLALPRLLGAKYVATDTGKEYFDNGTTLIEVGSGAGGGGVSSYVVNNDFENDASSWTGSANISVTRETTNPLTGSGSGRISASSSALAGEYVEADMNSVDRSALGLMIVRFTYDGALLENFDDYEVVIYDVTDAIEREVEVFSSMSKTDGVFLGQFFSGAGSDYKLRFKLKNVPVSVSVLDIDDVTVDKSDPQVVGSMSNWRSFTPLWTDATTDPVIGNGTLKGVYRRVGDSAQVKVLMVAGTTTTFGSGGGWRFSLPLGLSMDRTSDKINEAGGFAYPNGFGWIFSPTSAQRQALFIGVEGSDTDDVIAFRTGGSTIDANEPFVWTTGDSVTFEYTVPIEGWSTEVDVLSGRKKNPVCSLSLDANFSTGAGGTFTVPFTAYEDNFGAYNSGTNRYIIPESGKYSISYRAGLLSSAAGLANISIERFDSGGASLEEYPGDYHNGGVLGMTATSEIRFNKGDQIQFNLFEDNGGNSIRASSGGTQWTHAQISRVPDDFEAIVGQSEPEVLTTRSDQVAFTSFVSNSYANLTGNTVDLKAGKKYLCLGSVDINDGGTNHQLTSIIMRWCVENGTNTTAVPAQINGSGLANISNNQDSLHFPPTPYQSHWNWVGEPVVIEPLVDFTAYLNARITYNISGQGSVGVLITAMEIK